MLVSFGGKTPRVAAGAFVAPTATLIGDVEVEEGASIWFGTVLRGDLGRIRVGRGSSVQDNAVVHTLPGEETFIGPDVTVGHGAVLHTCRIERGAVIGMNAVLLDGSVVGEEAMLAAGSVLVDRAVVPARHLAAGAPAEVKKELSDTALWWVRTSPASYQQLMARYLEEGIGGVGGGRPGGSGLG